MSSLRLLVTVLVAVWASATLFARDAFVLYSGGGTPLTNNYSQYLQARELTRFLLENYPSEAVWIFFGIGNREGEPAMLADVRRQVKAPDGQILESWLAGSLPRNRPATKAEFLRTLRDEVLPTVRDGGTLYLFVGDHGTQEKSGRRESLITLWQLKPEGERGWRTDESETLSVTELQAILAEGLGSGRVVFTMTQCHSGGFHHLGVPRFLPPAPGWFAGAMPAWAGGEGERVLPRVAGFTATDEDSLAAGCDPDPDPDRWAGYERYLPEALLGLDLFSGERTGPRATSFAAAHAAAVLVDQTIDRPRSSSEHYLERWAMTIERLSEDADLLTPEAADALAAYHRDVDRGLAESLDDSAFAARRAEFDGFVRRLAEQNPQAADTVLHGNRAALERMMSASGRRAGAPSQSARRPSSLAREWREKFLPRWKAAVEAGLVEGLTDTSLAFERHLLAAEERGRDVMFPRNWQNPMLNDLYWRSGYAHPARLDLAKAEAVARWGADRRARIAAWAENSDEDALQVFGRALRPRPPRALPPRTLRADIAAERTLFYRRTLAAWKFLATMREVTALRALQELSALEAGTLPPPR